MISLSQERGFVPGVIIAAVSVLLAACFDYLVFGKALGLGFSLFTLLVLALSLAVIPRRRFQTEFLWVLIPLLFFSWMVFVRASLLLTALNILATILLFLLLADLMTGKKLRSFLLRQYADIVVLPLRFFQPLGETLSDVVSLRGVHQHSDVVSRIFKGLFMAIPVLMIFAALFSFADLLFAKYLTEMFTFNWNEETVSRVVRSVVITCAFVGAYSYVLRAPLTPHAFSSKKVFSLGIIEVSIFLGAINLLFLCFILIQLVYLFGGEDSIVSQGFTYAEYARKGFFELIVIALVSFLLLWMTEQALPTKETMHHTMPFKILSGMLVAEVIVIMISAFTRLSLYEAAYGFTTLRLYSHAFIIFLSVVFLILLYKICVDTRENIFAHRMFLAVIAFLVAMNILNPDAFIARKNIELFAATPEKLDIDYLRLLSADAVLAAIDTIVSRNPDVLNWSPELDEFSPWQSMHISRMKAKSLLGTLRR